ncbi:uncharacterized protein EI97DRAFT_447448 [Westerdykella ornata]|uniref:TNFR-Cys domain-containing protein n=1 Tax=Westerdykella ornata TaxID=318751 RepID=A0A6A6JZ48_WESOR|nr:uncharacterized protein EI97DRAFT_447448 [Westerdykella ornata]KAF2281485.1 hypothetical protein EI97DRAFT_447448 [Westerdykella ornata]
MKTNNMLVIFFLAPILTRGSQPTSWSLPHRVEIGAPTIPSRRNSRLEEKGQNKQIPFAFCPEFFEEDPKLCSQCGGDTKVKGTCNDLLVSGDQTGCPGGRPCRGYFCKCSDIGGPDNNPKVTMTSVKDGQTGVVVWEPMTLEEYNGLRASTTISMTETATATGAESELETVAAVVFAGGIAWYLACSREDDQSCKSEGQKPDCEDCGGNTPLGLCASGNQQNCPCEEQECPKDDPPSCPAPECSGDDTSLQCSTRGKLKGCQCCPEKLPTCEKDDCKGNNDDKCQADMYKGCSCEHIEFPEVEAPIDEPFPSTPDTPAFEEAAREALETIWGGKRENMPGYEKKNDMPDPFCLYG